MTAGRGAKPPAGYRPDIDGLRAVAVALVVVFHAFPESIPGGFVGVDVFFVISGFLISGILISALEERRFNLRDFYSRRIRRIFPALAIVLAACYLAGWYLLFADDYQRLAVHIRSGVLFMSNFTLWQEAGYFDAAAETKPLQHLWSLGVEEQFYLVWPLLLWLAWQAGVRPLRLIVVVLSASLLWNLISIRSDLVGTFYSPLTRFWQLLVGATLACVPYEPGVRAAWERLRPAEPHVRRRLASATSATGVVLIAVAAVFLSNQTHYPGRWALLPTAGALLVVAGGPDAWLNRRWLAQPAAVWLGLISYPLYLWHWPLLSFSRVAYGATPPATVRGALVVASVALAWFTFALVERPIRFGSARRVAVAGLCTVMVAILALAEYTNRTGGLFERAINVTDAAHFQQYYDRLRRQGTAEAYRQECDFMDWPTGKLRPAIDASCTQAGSAGTWLLWGDSHAQALSSGLRAVAPQGVQVAQVATSLCRPDVAEYESVPDGRCRRANAFAVASIRALRPGVVVLAQSGAYTAVDWEALARQIIALGASRVVVVGPAPQWAPSLPEVVAKQYWGRDFHRVSHGLAASVLESDRQLKTRLANSTSLTYVSLIDGLCTADGCQATVGDSKDLLTLDYGHLTPKGSVFVAETILRPALLGGRGAP